MAARIGTIVQFVLALAIFYLGYTIHQMTSKVSEIVETYPQVISDINSLSENLQIEEWLQVAETAELLVPDVVRSVDEISKSVVAVNQTVASLDAKLPSVLEELSHYRQDVIPAVVGEAANYRKEVIPPVLAESVGYRNTTIPMIVEESTQLRQEIPPMLAKADEIVDQSQQIAEQATSGAVKGVIMSPINLIKDAGTELKGKIILEQTPQSE